MMVNNNNNMM